MQRRKKDWVVLHLGNGINIIRSGAIYWQDRIDRREGYTPNTPTRCSINTSTYYSKNTERFVKNDKEREGKDVLPRNVT